MKMRINLKLSSLAIGVVLTLGSWVLAQQPSGSAPAPDPLWTGSLGAGFALTGGNTDTTNFNMGFDLLRDPKTRNLMKFNGLYLRGDTGDVKTTDQLRLGFRDEYTVSNRTFVFGTLDYLRDPFKEIDYLINPTGGVGYKVFTSDRAEFVLDGGAGVVWEKNPGFDVSSSGSLNAGESFTFNLTEGSRFTQVWKGLWKMDDFEDALHHFAVGLATSITSRSELKVEFIDNYKNVTPGPNVKKNDTAFVTSFLFKF